MRWARAAIGPLLLAGFYLLTAAVIAGVVAINAVMLQATGRLISGVAFASAFIIFALLRSVFFVAKTDDEVAPTEVDVPRDAEPRLWALVDATAAAMDTRTPDAIRLTHDVNASVSEQSRFLGLVPGRRVLRVGVALLQVLRADELKAVLAHEMGHYAGGDTRLGAVSYRGSVSITRAVEHLGRGSWTGRLFSAYARLYFRATFAVRRRQELTADAAAVAIAGTGAHGTALTKVAGAAAAYDAFLHEYASSIWESALLPADLYGGFRRYLEEPSRQEQVAGAVEAALQSPPDPYDTHPSLAQRLAAVGTGTATANPGEPARSILTDPERSERVVAAALGGAVTGRERPEVIHWDDAATRVYGRRYATVAGHLHALVGELDGSPQPATLGRLAQWLDSDAVTVIAGRAAGDLSHLPPEHHAEAQAETLIFGTTASVGTALVEQGRGRWAMSWAGPADVVDESGTALDVAGTVRAALDDEGQTVRATLLELGLEPEWAPDPAPTRTDLGPRREQLVGIVSDVAVGRRRFDLVLYDDGFALVKAQMSLGDRIATALAASTGGLTSGTADRRCAVLAQTPRDELVGLSTANRFEPWATVGAANLRRRLGSWRLDVVLLSGERVRIQATALSPARAHVAPVLDDLLDGRLLEP